jgi:hypothetical protein
MKKRILTGLVIGLVAGIIDLIPMIIQKLPCNADLSAFSMWVVVGFILAITDLKLHGIFKGLILSFLVLLPNLFIIGWDEPLSLIPIFIMTLILGSLAGLFYHIFTRPKKQ